MKRVGVRVRRGERIWEEEEEEERERERSPGPERQNRCLNGVALFPSLPILLIAPSTSSEFQFSVD